MDRRNLLKAALVAAVASATPHSRLLAASQNGEVELALANGKRLSVTPDTVWELSQNRKKIADGAYKLATGGRVEVAKGILVGASNAGGPVHVECVWIEFADEKKNKKARAAAHKFLVSNGGASLSHEGMAQARAGAC